MEFSVDLYDIQFESTLVRSPYSIDFYEVIDDVAVVVLNSFMRQGIDDPDFELESDARNVIGFNCTGDILWTLPDVPRNDDAKSDAHYYRRVYRIDDTVYAKHTNGTLYEIDVKTGTLVNSWPDNHLPLRGSAIQLAGEIHVVIETADRVFVRCRESDVDIYAFDKAGNELWHSEERRGMIYLIDGDLYESVERGPRHTDWHRVDQDTGERIEQVDSPL